jgi:NDP-sugar pyrophosphorylase family protein
MIKSAIILCGGKATRLGALAKDRPKILMSLREDGYTMLDAQLDMLRKNGITNIVFASGYLSEAIDQHMQYAVSKGRHDDITYRISKEDRPLGTGGAMHNAYKKYLKTGELFVGMNGDVYCPEVNITEMLKIMEHDSKFDLGRDAAIVMANHPVPYGVIETGIYGNHPAGDSSNVSTVSDFSEKKGVWINAGVYVINPRIFRYGIEKGNSFSIERDVFPGKSMYGVKYTGPWFDIGTPESLEACKQYISKEAQRV